MWYSKYDLAVQPNENTIIADRLAIFMYAYHEEGKFNYLAIKRMLNGDNDLR